MKKEMALRGMVYVAGLVILAFGITLNSKVGLGVSPLVSIAFCLSEFTELSFADATLLEYCMFVLIELVLHAVTKRGRAVLVLDILQIPLSLAFTRFMSLFSGFIPDFATTFPESAWGGIPVRLLILLLAVAFTGIGSAMSIDMRIVPNPGDGIVQALSDVSGRETGFVKNCFDLLNVCIAAVLGLTLLGRLSGVGIGTVIAVLGVGRVVFLFNRLFLKKIRQLAGMEGPSNRIGRPAK